MPEYSDTSCAAGSLSFCAGPTIGAEQARTIVDQVHARLVVPHHYRTKRIDFLEPLDAFASRFTRVHEVYTPVVELDDVPGGDGPLLVVPAAP